MTFDVSVVVVAFITLVGGGGLVGWAAWHKAGSEARKADAEARLADAERADKLADASGKVIDQLVDQMTELKGRVGALETTESTWEAWGGRVVDVLDRVFNLLNSEQQAHIVIDVAEVKRTRPGRGTAKKEGA